MGKISSLIRAAAGKKRFNSAIILAAGSGRRFGDDRAKQFVEIDGVSVLVRSARAFDESEEIHEIVVVTRGADIDGCSRAGTFFRIVLPLLQPVFVTVLVLNGLWIWNDYLLPLLLLGSNGEVRTIPLAVQGFIGSFVKQWNLIMVSTLLAMLPIIILYIFAQKYIVQGMVEGAVK